MKAIRAGAPAPAATEADLTRAQIAALFPGWQVWYIPASGTWNARPWPLVSAGSAGQLMDEMALAHAEAGEKWPALAADYDLTSMPAEFPYDIPGIPAPDLPDITALRRHHDQGSCRRCRLGRPRRVRPAVTSCCQERDPRGSRCDGSV